MKPVTMTFPTMWNTYTGCRSEGDADQMWIDAQRLHQAVRAMDKQAQESQILPSAIEEALAEPPPRLAVDPQAMAASCSLLAGQTALNTGHSELASRIFQFVLSQFSHPRYTYYLDQARKGLEQIQSTVYPFVATGLKPNPYGLPINHVWCKHEPRNQCDDHEGMHL